MKKNRFYVTGFGYNCCRSQKRLTEFKEKKAVDGKYNPKQGKGNVKAYEVRRRDGPYIP